MQTVVSRLFLDELCAPLGDHHDGEIGVGVDDGGHDRRVADPQIVDAVDAHSLVDHGHVVRRRPHLARADTVIVAGVGRAREFFPVFVEVG